MNDDHPLNVWLDLFAAGLGMMSGEDVIRRAETRRESERIIKHNRALQEEMRVETERCREEQAEHWEEWLKPTKFHPDPVIVDARFT
jgi:hypothetical protein